MWDSDQEGVETLRFWVVVQTLLTQCKMSQGLSQMSRIPVSKNAPCRKMEGGVPHEFVSGNFRPFLARSMAVLGYVWDLEASSLHSHCHSHTWRAKTSKSNPHAACEQCSKICTNYIPRKICTYSIFSESFGTLRPPHHPKTCHEVGNALFDVEWPHPINGKRFSLNLALCDDLH